MAPISFFINIIRANIIKVLNIGKAIIFSQAAGEQQVIRTAATLKPAAPIKVLINTAMETPVIPQPLLKGYITVIKASNLKICHFVSIRGFPVPWKTGLVVAEIEPIIPARTNICTAGTIGSHFAPKRISVNS